MLSLLLFFQETRDLVFSQGFRVLHPQTVGPFPREVALKIAV
jgi:hypothetical protein